MKYIIALILLSLTSCQRACNRFDRAVQASERNYIITVFSGGDTIYTDKFKGIVNDSEQSDGIYYYNQHGELVEISGDYIIISE